MNYWIHRCCNHENGLCLLDKEHRLTIGFAGCANDEDMLAAIKEKAGKILTTLIGMFTMEIFGGLVGAFGISVAT